MVRDYHARGKLLLTGEYVVMHGALALACPTRRGQSMYMAPHRPACIHWKAFTPRGDVWLAVEWNCLGMIKEITKEAGNQFLEPEGLMPSKLLVLQNKGAGTEAAVSRLESWITHAMLLSHQTNPEYFHDQIDRVKAEGISVETYLEFEREWGLGSSSSLISLLAQWWGCRPMELHAATQGGSGYDQACATASGPIHYQLLAPALRPHAQPIAFQPDFHEHLLFVYTGKKQSTDHSIRQFGQRSTAAETCLQEISECTHQLTFATDLKTFMEIMHRHERIMSGLLGEEPIQSARFSGFPGQTKSLGAWGGDFILAATSEPEHAKVFLTNNGFSVIFAFHELLLCPPTNHPQT